MKLKSRLVKKVTITFILMIVAVSAAHAIIFPQESRNMAIGLYQFERDGNLYFRESIDEVTKTKLKVLLSEAQAKNKEFWGELKANTKVIYCHTNEDYMKFGLPFMTPGVARTKLGSYVVLSPNGLNVEVLAHELSHTEFNVRIGFFNQFKIPTWFNEGLAMQVDNRSLYSTESLRVHSHNYTKVPEVKQLNSFAEFAGGTPDQVQLNFMTARYEVGLWYTKERLDQLIQAINQGDSFCEAFNKLQ